MAVKGTHPGSAKHLNWEFSTVAEGPSDRLSTEAALISKVTPGPAGGGLSAL